jgi:hypothetical protein
MRALLLTLAACGSTSVQPVATNDGRFDRAPAFNRRADAGVADAAAETSASVTAPTQPTGTVADVLKAEGAAIESATTEPEVIEPAEPELPENVTMEDGIPVIRTHQRAWCGEVTCWPRQAFCKEKNKGKACVLHNAYACFKFTYRTSGERTTACTPTYGDCDKFSDLIVQHPESADVGECAIMRYDPKYRPKK